MSGIGNNVLIVNAGSSSVKFRLYARECAIIDGEIDSIGGNARVALERDGKRETSVRRVPDIRAAEAVLLQTLRTHSCLDDVTTIVHRVVHGGAYTKPERVTPRVLAELRKLTPLAPLHQPPSLELITLLMKTTKARHIACFDTMFHASMPRIASVYAIPRNLTQKYQIKRYGFHGLAHAALAVEAQRQAKKSYRRIITCQLGNGVSMCAIRDGKSIDTSMGFTPLEGLPMGTRSGSIDPAILPFLCAHEKKTPQQILALLEHESGLKALSGVSDVREVRKRAEHGEQESIFALDFFAYHVRKQIGAYLAALNGAECIALGGGMTRAPSMRRLVLSSLEQMGLVLDAKALAHAAPAKLSKGEIDVWALETDEQKYMYELAQEIA